jgi:hypothetical protein
MSTIYKIVSQIGGDYNSIEAAFDDMLISGVADPSIDNFMMTVDSGVYTGTLSGFIPNSGTFRIHGNQTYFILDNSINLSGNKKYTYQNNLILDNFIIDCSGVSSYWYVITSGFGLQLSNIQLINNFNGILNSSGSLECVGVSSCGLSGSVSGSYFLISDSGMYNDIQGSMISCYNTGLFGNKFRIGYDQSIIHDNGVGIYCSGTNNILDFYNSLMYNNSTDINIHSGELYTNQSTFNSPIYIKNTLFQGYRIIASGIEGPAYVGSSLNDSCLYPYSILDANIATSNIINKDPKFNDAANNDYRLKFGQNGSPCISISTIEDYDSVDFNLDTSKIVLSDDRGKIIEFLSGIFVQNNTLIFSDYGQEIRFAEFFKLHKNTKYKIGFNILFDQYDTMLKNSFSPQDDIDDPHPWDWESMEIQTPKITEYNTYIIPRSFIDIPSIIDSKSNGILTQKVYFSGVNYDNIKLYKKYNIKGISYDEDLSSPNNSVAWLIDGTNQALIKENVYTNEELEYYPLCCSTPSKGQIRPSGLIYTGVKGDYYTFLKFSDPNKELIGPSENGDFYWVKTDINTTYDLRGIKTYKDNLFITGSQYIGNTVTNRYDIPLFNSVGIVLQYNSNDHFFNYIKMDDKTNTDPLSPKLHILQDNNHYPTDITTYEDGSLLIADYLSKSGIFKYRPAYDYALITSRYDNEARVLLREFYDNVDL